MSSFFQKTSVSDHFGRLNLSDSSESIQPTNPKIFRDGRPARPSDVFIALVGVTGSGKSTFISLCGHRAAKVGHQLGACTTVVDVYACELSASRTVYLIDTPGFDDTSRSDTEVLREIASWLAASYTNKVLLHGMIYLHRITDVRMQGSAKKNLLMFKKLCGDDALRKVVLTTTMWDKIPHDEGVDREQQLSGTPEFWGFMISKGSTVYRHDNTVESAIRIINVLAHDNSTVTLDLQSQMVNQKQALNETAAGRELESELIKERQKWAAELLDAQKQMEEAIRLRDKESEQALREIKDEFIAQMRRLELENKQLHINTERLRDAKIEKLEKALEKKIKAQADELKKLHQKSIGSQMAPENTVKASILVSDFTSTRLSTSFKGSQLFSASLCADHWSLYGPKSYYENFMPANKCKDISRLHFIVCGTKGSWVCKYRTATGEEKLVMSKNFEVEYPQLAITVCEWSYEKLLWISLGPNETYFMKGADTYEAYLPLTMQSEIRGVIGGITAFALGIDETYVIVHGNQWSWNLKGHYSGLDIRLEKAMSAPRLVALNSQNQTDYLVLTTRMNYSLTTEIRHRDSEDFRKWISKNGV